MKTLLVFALTVMSLSALAQDKCYGPARAAAIKYAIANDYVATAAEFRYRFGDELSEISVHHGSWHKETHSFSDGSMGISVEVDYARGRCFVKKVDWFQDDQDWD